MPQHPGGCSLAALGKGRQRRPCHLHHQPAPHIHYATVKAAQIPRRGGDRQPSREQRKLLPEHVFCARCNTLPQHTVLSVRPNGAQATHSKNSDERGRNGRDGLGARGQRRVLAYQAMCNAAQSACPQAAQGAYLASEGVVDETGCAPAGSVGSLLVSFLRARSSTME